MILSWENLGLQKKPCKKKTEVKIPKKQLKQIIRSEYQRVHDVKRTLKEGISAHVPEMENEMKVSKKQLKRIIKEGLMTELFPNRPGEEIEPITQEFLGDMVKQAEGFIEEAMVLRGYTAAQLLRLAADYAEGKR